MGRYKWDFSLLGEEAFDFGLICVATPKFSVIDIDLSIFRLLLPREGERERRNMWILSRFWEKVCKVAEGGSRYCSKKSDDNCGDEVKVIPFSPPFSVSLSFFFSWIFILQHRRLSVFAL